MAFSNQTAVSDGTLQTIILSIAFFDKTEIHVFRDGVEIFTPADYVWATSNSIQFPAPQALGVEILLRRVTDISEMRHIFTEGAQFTNQTLDEDYTQILHIAQEAVEGGNIQDIFHDLDMHDHQINNIADGVLPNDAANLGQIDSRVANNPFLLRAIRAPATDPVLTELPDAATRFGKLVSFDGAGNPIVVAAAAGSATQLEIDLADTITVGKGAAKVGRLGGGTVADAFDTAVAKGAQLIPQSAVRVPTIVDLLTRSVANTHTYLVDSYFPSLNRGGGKFIYLSTVAKSLHDGGLIISPTVPWDGLQATHAAFLLGTGETLPAGTGCFVRIVDGPIYVDMYGAGNGVSDGAPVRRALDKIPTTGGTREFQGGVDYKILEVVYIPQRMAVADVVGYGVRLRGNGARIIGNGDGTNTIFESGTGQFSTVSLGGATNFGQADESVASMHNNSEISGFNFQDCGAPIRLFNWLQGCLLGKLYATRFTTMIETDRCFYLSLTDIQGRPLQSGRAATTPIFKFNDSNNTMTFTNVHCSGITSGGIPKGVGWEFDGGVQGTSIPAGCSAEGCVTGLVLKSLIYSMGIMGVYFEANVTAIASSAANLFNLVVDYCEFEDNATDINVDNWIDGYFGAGNRTENLVVFGNGCTHDVFFPAQTKSELNHTTWVKAPVGWTVPAGCQVHRNDIIFNSAVGFSAVWFRNNPLSGGNTGIVPMSFTGDCFNVGGTIPFCTVAGVGTGTLTIDTKIAWNPNMSAVRFDLLVVHSANAVIAGVLSANNTVFRDDAVAGITITPADNGGFLRFTFAGFGTITSVSGKVRII